MGDRPSAPPASQPTAEERRKYRRIRAPLHYRFIDTAVPSPKGDALDISLGGVRIYSHRKLPKGAVISLEIFRPYGPPATYRAQVMWVQELPQSAPARFDLGLRFTEIESDALAFLTQVIGPE